MDFDDIDRRLLQPVGRLWCTQRWIKIRPAFYSAARDLHLVPSDIGHRHPAQRLYSRGSAEPREPFPIVAQVTVFSRWQGAKTDKAEWKCLNESCCYCFPSFFCRSCRRSRKKPPWAQPSPLSPKRHRRRAREATITQQRFIS